MKLEKFDNQTVRDVFDDLEIALATVAMKWGCSIVTSGARHNPTCFELKVQIAVVGDDGIAMTPEWQDFVLNATAFGLLPSDIGARVTIRDSVWQIIGLRRKSKANPILLMGLDRKLLLAPAAVIARALGRSDREIATAEMRAAMAKTRANGEGAGDCLGDAAARGESWAIDMIETLNKGGADVH